MYLNDILIQLFRPDTVPYSEPDKSNVYNYSVGLYPFYTRFNKNYNVSDVGSTSAFRWEDKTLPVRASPRLRLA
jgi:hypothetical protein